MVLTFSQQEGRRVIDGVPAGGGRARRWLRLGAPEADRLSADIEEVASDLERRGQSDTARAISAKKLLVRARAEQSAGRYGSGWSSLNAARREIVDGYDPTEIDIARSRLRHEAREKLSNWRGGAVEADLGPIEATRNEHAVAG